MGTDVTAKATWRIGDDTTATTVQARGDGAWDVQIGERAVGPVTARRTSDGTLIVGLPDGRTLRATVTADGERRWVTAGGVTVTLERDAGRKRRGSDAHAGGLESPLPGRVIAVDVDPGDEVHAGQTLLLIEAMKMEHPIKAPHAGVVVAVRCKAGDMVQPGVALVELRPLGDGKEGA